jgi:hypothetical protein
LVGGIASAKPVTITAKDPPLLDRKLKVIGG